MDRNILFHNIIMFFLIIFLFNSNLFSEKHLQRFEDDGSNEIPLKSNKSEVNINILKTIPAPGLGDSRGLTWDGVNLWFAEDDSKLIFKIDTASGAVLDSFPTPGLSYTEGLAWDGMAIWHAEYNGRMYKIDPSNGAYLDSLGWAYYRKGKFELALKNLLEAEKQLKKDGTPDPVVFDHIGDLYKKIGNKTKAIEYWKKSLKIESNPKIGKKIKEIEQ